MTKLSTDLQAIYDLEISLGNTVARIDEPAGSICPYAIIFATPLHLDEINSQIALPPTVEFWISTDPHYPLENGYSCEKTHHVIAGPLPQM